MGAPRVESGIGRITKSLLLPVIYAMFLWFAPSAVESSWLHVVALVLIGFAATPARPARSGLVVQITTVKNGDSYCLTVDDPSSAFCVEGGYVVHNCLRYRVADMDALPVEAVRRAAPGSVDHCIAEFKRSDLRRGRKRMDGTSRNSDLAKLPPKLADFFRGRRL